MGPVCLDQGQGLVHGQAWHTEHSGVFPDVVSCVELGWEPSEECHLNSPMDCRVNTHCADIHRVSDVVSICGGLCWLQAQLPGIPVGQSC